MKVSCIKNFATRSLAVIAIAVVFLTGTGIARAMHLTLEHSHSQTQLDESSTIAISKDASHRFHAADCPTCHLLHSLHGIVDHSPIAQPLTCMLGMPAAPPDVVVCEPLLTRHARGPPV